MARTSGSRSSSSALTSSDTVHGSGRVVVAGGHLPRRRHQLLEEERVPAGAHVEGVDGAERRLLVEHGGEEAADLGGPEAVEVHVRDPVPAVEPGHGLGRRVAAGQAVGPVGADQHEATRRARAPGGGGSARRSKAVMLSESAQCRSSNTTRVGPSPARSPNARTRSTPARTRSSAVRSASRDGRHEGREVGAAVVGHRGARSRPRRPRRGTAPSVAPRCPGPPGRRGRACRPGPAAPAPGRAGSCRCRPRRTPAPPTARARADESRPGGRARPPGPPSRATDRIDPRARRDRTAGRTDQGRDACRPASDGGGRHERWRVPSAAARRAERRSERRWRGR